ncbi:hypothetical protein VNI00_003928 [Paramarasmius palmivorus]|uniref:ubiquitinyl hydrolase 1 n=1 Tax=Paramarasmius palmivorus TaxID=297713 RepID=A0AAW0DQK8_9AGAR
MLSSPSFLTDSSGATPTIPWLKLQVMAAYEAVTLSAFLLLLIEYVAATASSRDAKNALARKDKRKLPMPWSVLQYVIIRPGKHASKLLYVPPITLARIAASIAGIICEKLGVLCEAAGFDAHWANVYLEAIDFVSISVALYGLLLFYGLTKEELAGRRPLAKFLAIKLIVMFTFYQSFVFSALEGRVIHATQYWTESNISNGLNALAICIEMIFFSILMWWAYNVREYKIPGQAPTSIWKPLWDSVNYSDFAMEIWGSLKFFVDYYRGVPTAHGHGHLGRPNFAGAFGVSSSYSRPSRAAAGESNGSSEYTLARARMSYDEDIRLAPYHYGDASSQNQERSEESRIHGQPATNERARPGSRDTHGQFTAPDLSEIARNLDDLEQSYDDDNQGTSSNMDDTGFFSVQVLENALSLAFILNHQQHWYTLRRFGPAFPNLDEDPGEGHWFNLNSFSVSPEWVGKLYLGMFLQEVERQGYSIFAVIQTDPTAPLALPRTEADDIAASIPEISFSNPDASSSRSGREQPEWADVEGLEDEDMELQAALAASLGSGPSSPPHLVRRPVPLPESGPPSGPGSGSHTPARSGLLSPLGLPAETAEFDDLDPVAASRERSRRRLMQMQAEQEQAHRELWDEGNRPNTSREEEYEEMLRRAIAESEAMAQGSGDSIPDNAEASGHGMEVDNDGPEPNFATSRFEQERVYDDDDAELQAALKASLEQAPHDWVPPPAQASASSVTQPQSQSTASSDKAELDTDMEEDEDIPSSPVPAQAVDMEEMRKRRLARFGG